MLLKQSDRFDNALVSQQLQSVQMAATVCIHTSRIPMFDNCTKRFSECLHPYKPLGGPPLLVHTLSMCSA